MSFYLGTPARKVIAIADTGSDLIWVQCKPCDKCFPQKTPLFDPEASTTYKASCGYESKCQYHYSYGDGSFANGSLSTDTIGFNATGGRQVNFPTTLFGCTHQSNGTFDKEDAGLVGLGGGRLSLVRQLGPAVGGKFSYCLPSWAQTAATARLNFGTAAVVNGAGAVTTPLIRRKPDTFYFLNLQQIIVAGIPIDVKRPNATADGAAVEGNIIIDSGTTLTLIDNETLHFVLREVESIVKLPTVTPPGGVFNLCFNVSGQSAADVEFPEIAFRFAGNASIVLPKDNLFAAVDEKTVCSVIVYRGHMGVNIFGNLAQQNFHIGYDLAAMKLTFAPANCTIFSNNFEYLMRFYLGTPARKVIAIADTGSDLIWIQCKPCDKCFPQKAPLFDPEASTTYKGVNCKATSCQYHYSYGDGSFAIGSLSTDTIGFNATGGRKVNFPKTLFGCTHRSNGAFDKEDAGLVGLGGGRLSLVRQLGPAIGGKFSYCLPSWDQTAATARLNFGTAAVVNGPGVVTTPLIRRKPDTFYFLNLQQIIVAVEGNIIIDSGTTLTLIDNETLHLVLREVKSIVKLPTVTRPGGVFNLCFNVSGQSAADVEFPEIAFRFAGNASIVLPKDNLFAAVDEKTVCSVIVYRGDMGVNIFGNLAQQNFHIGYDLAAMKLTFAPANCTDL
ncbi:Aspartic proteinase CDR1 [Apostasia shenzhenica]|uniref:Aspartic proteinase CDR1 n=1 Tax=Apostasia shenzhenica TaxID=1088818 RepID=A0A2I0BA68_9ASPA|nr:Aspartic proteinase CDR1 [Apostasia shenzhenica]